ncbi:hypothetical protein ALQ97_02469 [Pseudomonas savastanoi pv. glycinea]|nr:hypothetical protein ALQ97_02469 [Pseudomonas savastanoi pv. glycinea]RML94472.1 hypothetical protein ALQ87_02078 [Pseudomonas savastanoi pv. glycinea]
MPGGQRQLFALRQAVETLLPGQQRLAGLRIHAVFNLAETNRRKADRAAIQNQMARVFLDPIKPRSSAGAPMKLHAFLLALMIPALSAHAEAKTINVPHDPTGQHALVEKSGSPQARVVVTRREGLLGVIYSKRVYNCANHTVNLVGTGSTLEIMQQARAVSGMGPVIRDSTADYIESEACS